MSSTLVSLEMSDGFLVGRLPTEIGLMTNLKLFNAASNDFHGPLPSQIGQLPILELLDLSENLISGELPSQELSSLTRLKHLSLSRKKKSGRKMSGPLPSFGTLQLETLTIDGNEFSGPIPIDFLEASVGLQIFNISGNRLDAGTVPAILADLPEADSSTAQMSLQPELDERGVLIDLFNSCGGSSWTRRDFWLSRVDHCSWHGVGCSDDGRVMLVNLQSNNLVGPIPYAIFNLQQLELMWLSDNPEITVNLEMASFSPKLRDLKLDNTTLSSLQGIEMARSLTALDVSRNKLGSTFPVEVMALENLRKLSLSNNMFEGTLPPSLASLPYLRILEAENNRFSGAFPSFSDSVALQTVRIGYNDIKGPIPSNFLESVPTFVAPKIFLQQNNVTSLPVELKRFENLTIDISENQILSIPSDLCEQSGWNDGDVGKYGCGALACAPGTTNRKGRQGLEYSKCVRCPAAARFFGQTDCAGDSSSDTIFTICMILLLIILLLIVSYFAVSYRRKRRLRHTMDFYSDE